MALENVAVAEKALALSPTDRTELAKLLIKSLEGDMRTDKEIKAELNRRIDDLVSGKDSGMNLKQIFGS